MAGSGTAHLRDGRRRPGAPGRAPRRRVPDARAARSTPSATSASTSPTARRSASSASRAAASRRPARRSCACRRRRRAACCSTASTCRRSTARRCARSRSRLQMIFQDAISSLNPRRTIREVVAEPLDDPLAGVVPAVAGRSGPGSATCRGCCAAGGTRSSASSPCPIVVAFFVGLIVWVVADGARRRRTPTASATAASVATVGNVLMIASLVVGRAVHRSCSSATALDLARAGDPDAVRRRSRASIRIRRGKKALRGRDGGQGPPGARGRRHRSRRRARPPTARVLRRPGAAHLDRPGPDPRPEGDHLRRAGVGPRRVRAGAGAQPARGPQGQVRHLADLHRPRPRRRQEHLRPRRRDVPRQDLRGRRRPTTCSPARCTRTPRS